MAEAKPSNPSTARQSPYLDSLLSKLRPFQRAAVEFAVHGILPADNCKKNVANRHKQHAASKAAYYAKRKGEKVVAGAGTGRILLGDEMGLG